jgi:DNA modification methylase
MSFMLWPPVDVDWYYSDEAVCIAHADCRSTLPLLPKVDLVLTDPPYGIGYIHGAETGLHTIASRFNNTPIVGDDKPFDPSPWLVKGGDADGLCQMWATP